MISPSPSHPLGVSPTRVNFSSGVTGCPAYALEVVAWADELEVIVSAPIVRNMNHEAPEVIL